MKRIILLLLLLMSSQIISQNINIRSIPEVQIPEIYKGLKQGEYLKVRLQKTEAALNNANQVINEQDKALTVSKSLLTAKDDAMQTMLEIAKQDDIAAEEREKQLKIDISILQNDINLIQKESKISQRKKLWTGIKIGSISVTVLGVAGLIWFNNK